MIVHSLFPQPVYFSKLERELTKEELKTIDAYKAKTYKNEGNITSNDTYVLENKALKNLKKDLNKKVINYFNEVVCTSNSIIPYITQSWINYTETNQFHHKHAHSNSYVSGVFYIDAQKKVDSIIFYKKPAPNETIELNITKYNPFNSTSCWFPVETGNILLFPSFLHHGVDKKKGTNTRISLSFNVFMKGKIGVKEQLTELVLE
jgi:uncharacterized protein (TIGR02466 family)